MKKANKNGMVKPLINKYFLIKHKGGQQFQPSFGTNDGDYKDILCVS